MPLLGAAPLDDEVAHWEDVHAPLFAGTPGLLDYVQYRPLPEERRRGFSQVCSSTTFADREAERAAYASEFYLRKVVPDEGSFLRRGDAWSARASVDPADQADFTVLQWGGARPGPAWRTVEVSRDLPAGGRALHVLSTADREEALAASASAKVPSFACRPVPTLLRSDAR